MLSITARNGAQSDAFLFVVPRDEGCSKPQLQVRMSISIKEISEFLNNPFAPTHRYLYRSMSLKRLDSVIAVK
jgi:hypothetical protein